MVEKEAVAASPSGETATKSEETQMASTIDDQNDGNTNADDKREPDTNSSSPPVDADKGQEASTIDNQSDGNTNVDDKREPDTNSSSPPVDAGKGQEESQMISSVDDQKGGNTKGDDKREPDTNSPNPPDDAGKGQEKEENSDLKSPAAKDLAPQNGAQDEPNIGKDSAAVKEVVANVKEEKQENGTVKMEVDDQGEEETMEMKVKNVISDYVKGKNLDKLTVKDVKNVVREKLGNDIQKQLIVQTLQKVLNSPEEESEEEDNENEEEEDEEEEKPKKRSASGKRKPTSSSKKKKKKTTKKKKNGFNKVMVVINGLEDILGVRKATRSEATKLLWVYIKKHDLQDPKDKRKILLDDKMQEVFKRKTLTMTSIAQHIGKFLCDKSEVSGFSEEESSEESSSSEAEEDDDDDEEEEEEEEEPKPRKKARTTRNSRGAGSATAGAKRKKGGGGGFTKPIPISDDLAEFLGQEEKLAARTQVTKALWAHIKANNLQNPNKKTEILCDDKLKTLFGRATVTSFSMNKFIQKHYI